jgi:sulfate/thiosulfate transport system permease protein
VLISGNLPFKTEVGAVYIFNQVENENVSGAAAVSVVLLLCALLVLGAMTWLSRKKSAHVL